MERARKNESVGENGARNGVTVLPESENEETNENRRPWEVATPRDQPSTPGRATRRAWLVGWAGLSWRSAARIDLVVARRDDVFLAVGLLVF